MGLAGISTAGRNETGKISAKAPEELGTAREPVPNTNAGAWDSVQDSVYHRSNWRSSGDRAEKTAEVKPPCKGDAKRGEQRGTSSTMGIFKKAKVEDNEEKKDLKANYATEDHKADLEALLRSFGTHATNVRRLRLSPAGFLAVMMMTQLDVTRERGRTSDT